MTDTPFSQRIRLVTSLAQCPSVWALNIGRNVFRRNLFAESTPLTKHDNHQGSCVEYEMPGIIFTLSIILRYISSCLLVMTHHQKTDFAEIVMAARTNS